ncbi:isocitrate lyase/phosphoenolpyruvate mutase family protein [Pedobacter sp. PLR]|uniref:isocitrate lyase/PEP mutase family protein n=1 Tax=Pedobacter sp. PLR TaxID=2994465 RepID=UPI002247060B|nr:isocitrate lyase/phosphoenolpyruvate mutase family protein [Pedobacter sp. PLR]MCX2454108.1 isocitrate lyase/phosphoenolpyruvate mutase family protein [Pedobacter sp. PLR]
MTMPFEKFKKLHHSEQPLLIGNVWDVQSALIYQNLGYQAIGTSSAAIATSFGYEDGENIPFQDYLFMIKRILDRTTLPLTVDLESGYGKDVKTIFENINKLYELGVVGINLEDSLVLDGIRSIADAAVFSLKLEQLVQMLKENNVEVFINVRCDTFLLGLPNALAETIARIKLYERTAIDGIFLPCLTDEKDIKSVIETTSVPINVMCMPDLPDFDRLKSLGIKRISMGNFVNNYIYQKMNEVSASFVPNQNFSTLF